MEKENKVRYWVWQAALDNKGGRASKAKRELDTIRQKLSHDVDGIILGYKKEMDDAFTSVSALSCGCGCASLLDDAEGLTALGYDGENVIGVFALGDKVIEVTYRLAKDVASALRLLHGVNFGSMEFDGFLKSTTSLKGLIGAPFFEKSLPLKRIFREIIVPRLQRETGYEVMTDLADKLDDALSYGLIGFRTAFPWIFEDTKGDHHKVTELALLLSHAAAYLSVYGDMDVASLFSNNWIEVDRYAVNELDDKGYSYYYQKTN